MFARVKKSGAYQYLQIVENRRVESKVTQRVIATVGRLDQLQAKGDVETLVRSLARFSEKTLLILSGKVEATAHAVSIRAGAHLRATLERAWPAQGHPGAAQGAKVRVRCGARHLPHSAASALRLRF